MSEHSEHEELLRKQDPMATSRWVEAELRRRSRAAEHHQPNTDTALSDYHGFRHLPADAWFNRVLAFGGGDGQEVLPVLDRTKEVTVIDASVLPLHPALAELGAEARGPLADGSIAEADGAFDLITCHSGAALRLERLLPSNQIVAPTAAQGRRLCPAETIRLRNRH